MHSDVTRDLTARTTLAKVTLAHAVEVAVALAPHAKKKQLDSKAFSPSEGKEEKVRRLAKTAGHSLNRTFRCAKCNLKVPFHKAMPHIEAVLACRCVGMAVRHDPSNEQTQLVNFDDHQHVEHDRDSANNLYALGQVIVHKTHKMATHVGLALRFCTRCGTHGANRSNLLKFACKKPTRVGLEALRCIRQGFQPSHYLHVHLARQGLKVWLGARNF